MDHLTRDVLEAKRLGYGCHYGWYKADHPHTKPVDDDLQALVCSGQEDTRICKQCGKPFVPEHRARQYCSDACKQIYSAKLNLEARRRAIANLPTKSCALCGKEFHPHNNKQIYCSISCAQRARWGLPQNRTCPVCGKQFHPKYAVSKYCGRACYLKDVARPK